MGIAACPVMICTSRIGGKTRKCRSPSKADGRQRIDREGPGETGWEALENELFEQLGPISPKRRKNLRAFIRLTGEYMRLRENQRYYFDKSWVLLRRLLLKIGERWAMDGRLGIREDIFHLSIEEIQTALECPHYLLSRETVEARKRLFRKGTGDDTPLSLERLRGSDRPKRGRIREL